MTARERWFTKKTNHLSEVGSILIVSDAWKPQTNGVVTTVKNVRYQLLKKGYRVRLLTPNYFKFRLPTYDPGVQLAIPTPDAISKCFQKFKPERIFIATEGPIGFAVRHYCIEAKIPFTTAYTTKWPEYLKQHMYLPKRLTWQMAQWFHQPAHAVMVATKSLQSELKSHGIHNVCPWTRGVDTQQFHRLSEAERNLFFPHLPRPFYVYAGRVSSEKNIGAFLDVNLPGTRFVIGEGSDLEALKVRYPKVVFTGLLAGGTLARYYASCDVFVFPSKTDTFGLVMLEALASGLPVVAFNITGPVDVIDPEAGIGYLANTNQELEQFCIQAWKDLQEKPALREQCYQYVLAHYSWSVVADILMDCLQSI
jgi:glycosyltransferase involved in cell wall biosynthesis